MLSTQQPKHSCLFTTVGLPQLCIPCECTFSTAPPRVLFYLIKGKKTDWFTNYTKISTPTLPDELYDEFHFRPKKKFNPWGSPGSAPIFGEGCGVNGGNPHGCQAGNLDTNPYGTCCSGGMYCLNSINWYL